MRTREKVACEPKVENIEAQSESHADEVPETNHSASEEYTCEEFLEETFAHGSVEEYSFSGCSNDDEALDEVQ